MTGSGVAGLLLAAGAGSRLGTPKALVEVAGELLVDRGVRLLADGGCTPVLVVLGAGASEVRARARLPAAVAVDNPGWAAGLSTSLRAGLAALPERAPTVGAVVVALVDQPLITATAVHRLIDVWRAGAPVVVAAYAGQPRNPVLLDRSVWAEVAAQATGEQGAARWLRQHAERVTQVDCVDVAAPDDIDTAADLDRLSSRL